MPRVHAIQSMMFGVPVDVDLRGTLYHALMPEEWTRLFEAVWPPWNQKPQVPYGTLGDSLRLLFPQVAHIASMSGLRMARDSWLYAWEKPGPAQFMALVEEWIRVGETDKATSTVIDQIHWNDLVWEKLELGFDQYGMNENGSPNLSSLHYSALPDLVCAKLAEREISIGEQEPLRFRRAYYGRTPHLISWPPEADVRRRSAWYWSYVLTPRMLTLPGCSVPFLSLSASVRRWASNSLRKASGHYDLPFPDATSVYVEVDDSWMSVQADSRATSLVGLPLKLRITKEDGRTIRMPKWDTPVDSVLKRIMAEPGLPGTVELTEDPTRFLHRERGSVAVTVRSQNKNAHQIGVGTPFADRKDIYRSVSEILSPYGFIPAAQSPAVQIPRARKKSLLRTKYSDIPGERVIKSIQRSLGDRLLIEVLYQTNVTRSALRSEIWRRLRKGRPSGDPPHGDTASLNGVEIHVSFRELGTLGSKLDGLGRAAEERRVNEIVAALYSSDVPIGCLVELQDADHFGSADPNTPSARDWPRQEGYLSS